MRILFLSSELAPFAKTGGLGDVSAALPRLLHGLGHDVRPFLPMYARVEAPGRSPHLRIHADSASGLFHLPGCEQYDCPQCRIEFKDAQIAREAGFKPCPFCRTLVEEQERQASTPPDA